MKPKLQAIILMLAVLFVLLVFIGSYSQITIYHLLLMVVGTLIGYFIVGPLIDKFLN